jgi:hypothetical protein
MRAGNPKIAYMVFSDLGKIAEVECAGASSHSRLGHVRIRATIS